MLSAQAASRASRQPHDKSPHPARGEGFSDNREDTSVSEIETTGDQSPFDAIRRVRADGSEYWSARDLMPLMGYAQWQNFMVPMSRAIKTAENQTMDIATLFMRSHEKTGGRPREDFELARYAAYLVAMNGDPNIPEVAQAQHYFAVRTREAETRQPAALTRREILQMAIEAEDRADAAESQVRELTAPARSWQLLADAHGDFSVAEAAKILSRDPSITTGRDRLFAFMAEQGWIFKSRNPRGGWEAYQTAVDTRRLVEKPARPFLNSKTGAYELPAPTIRVTAKGIGKLHELMGGTEPIRFVVGEAS